MALTYSISRESAASYLWVSTRTVDRYVKSGKLSYKKIANKVILAKEEVEELKNEFGMIQQDEYQTEIVSDNSKPAGRGIQPMSTHTANTASIRQIDQKMDKFFDLLKEKDTSIENKNQMIFILQQKLGELEGKLKHMIALPEYHEEKAQLIKEKDILEQKVKELHRGYSNEKRKNTIYIIVMWAIICAAVILMFLKQ